MKNTIENNLMFWDQQYKWSKDGDEWDGQARFCRQPYDKWKESLVETFIAPNLSPSSVVLEIAPGHGRWSKEMVSRCKNLILVDLSPSCIEFCKKLFASYHHVRYITNDGMSLDEVEDNDVDFIWSYDSFVHMEKDTIGNYLNEIYRVLKPEGKAIIHHAGRTHAFLWLGFMMSWRRTGMHIYKFISMGKLTDTDGWRSNISKQLFSELAVDKRLEVEAQIQVWGKNNEFGVPRFGDFLTILRKKCLST